VIDGIYHSQYGALHRPTLAVALFKSRNVTFYRLQFRKAGKLSANPFVNYTLAAGATDSNVTQLGFTEYR